MAAAAASGSRTAVARSAHLSKRLTREIAALAKEGRAELGIKICVPEDDLGRPWRAYMRGPAGTAYEGCVYAISVTIPGDYPHAPPTVMFLNRCWHPNIGVNGHVCVDILKSQWSPTLTVLKLLQSVQSLLDDPDPTSPLNGAAAAMVVGRDRAALRAAVLGCVHERYELTDAEKAFEDGKPVLVEE
jgi:ubiquitin-protein ligase